MKNHSGFLTVSFLLMSSLSRAQDRCPDEFRYAGTLSGIGSQSEKFDKTVVLRLPEGAKLDESYQQTSVRSTNEKRKAQSNLRPQDIPKGIHITPRGSGELDKVWVVSEPKLIETKAGASPRYAFGMHLFCSVPDSSFSQVGGGCDVAVEVCYKPKPRN